MLLVYHISRLLWVLLGIWADAVASRGCPDGPSGIHLAVAHARRPQLLAIA